MRSNDEIYDRLSSIKDLPILPTVATKLMNLLSNPNSSIKEISSVIISDPSITTKVLKIANSAFYTTTKEITSARMALVIIGQSQISNIVYSLSLFQTFSDVQDQEFQRKFYTHALASAYLTKDLATRLKIRKSAMAFTAGLIYDIGLIIINQYFHNYFRLAKIHMDKNNVKSQFAFEEVMGIEPRKIGAWVAEHWKLPRPLVNILAGEKGTENPDEEKLTAIIHLSKMIASLAGFELLDTFSENEFIESSAWNSFSNEIDIDFKENILADIMFKKEKIEDYVSVILNTQ